MTPRKRKLVDEVCGEWSVSIGRACQVLMMDTSTHHYRARRPGQAPPAEGIREICAIRCPERLSVRPPPG